MTQHYNSNRPTIRPLPAGVPSQAALKIGRAEFFDPARRIMRQQWQAHVLPEGKTQLTDFIKVVINFHHLLEPEEGQIWLVTLDHMAPKTEIIFATAVKQIEDEPKLQPVSDQTPIQSAGDLEHDRVRRTVCAWMATLPKKLEQLAEHFRR